MKRILALITTAVTALVVCSTAFANSLTCGHGETCGSGGTGGTGGVQGGVFASQPIGHSGGGTLPYTGLNLLTVAAIAVLLIAAGLTLRWATARRS